MVRDGTFIYPFHKTGSGVWIDEGIRVAQGELLYRDFVETIGPGQVYLNAALARLFGANLEVFAWAGLALGVLLVVALHWLSARLVPGGWRLLPALLFLALVYPPFDLGHPRWPALLLGIPAVGLAATGRLSRTVWAGLLLGAATLFARDVGIGLSVGVTAHLVTGERRWSRLAALILASLAPIALVLAGFALAAGLAPLLESWIRAPWSQVFAPRALRPLSPWGPRSAAYVLMAAAGLWSALRRPGREENAGGGGELRAVRFAGVGLLATAFTGELDSYALGHRAILLTIPLAHGLRRLHALGNTRRRLAWGLMGLLLPGLIQGTLGLLLRRQWLDPLVRQRFRAGEAWIGAPNHELPWLESRTRPGELTFVFPAGGHAYGLTRTRNATSFPCLIEGRATLAEQRRALAEVRARRPRLGLWLEQRPPGADSTTLSELYSGLLETYLVERRLRNGTLLLRRRERLSPQGSGLPGR